MEETKTEEELSIEFKTSVIKHIHNRRELSNNSKLTIDIAIQCFYEEFELEYLFQESKMIKLYNFLYLLNNLIDSSGVIHDFLLKFWTKNFHSNIDLLKQYDRVYKLVIEMDEKISIQQEKGSPFQRNRSNSLINKMSQSSSLIKHNLITPQVNDSNQHAELLLEDETIETDDKFGSSSLRFMRRPQKRKTYLCPLANQIDSPLFNDEEEIEEINIIHKKNHSTIRFMTVDLLIKKISLENYYFISKDVVDGFIEQFAFFIRTDILIHKIINAFLYFIKEMNKIPYDLLLFFNRIIDKKFPIDIKGKQDLIYYINDFYKQILAIDSLKQKKNISDEIIHKIEMFSYWTNRKNSTIAFSQSDLSNNPSSFNNSNNKDSLRRSTNIFTPVLDLFEFDNDTIALQLTYITNKLLLQIKPDELYPSIKNRSINAPNLTNMINRTNKLTMFIIEEICSYDYHKKRTKLIEKFIHVADELRKLNNFNDLLIVMSALSHLIIQHYLIDTWKDVGKKEKELFNELKSVVSLEESYKNIRSKTALCQNEEIPYTPYIGITLKRLYFMEEGHKYIKNKILVNIEKIILVGSLIKEFIESKKNLMEVKENNLLSIFEHLNPKNEEELTDIAMALEPEFTFRKKKQTIKRRSQLK